MVDFEIAEISNKRRTDLGCVKFFVQKEPAELFYTLHGPLLFKGKSKMYLQKFTTASETWKVFPGIF